MQLTHYIKSDGSLSERLLRGRGGGGGLIFSSQNAPKHDGMDLIIPNKLFLHLLKLPF